MCGIAGIMTYQVFNSESLRASVVDMANTLIHRGPDAGGLWLHPTEPIALAHRRLSIQDLSLAGSQPMTSPSGRFTIVFNGEVYNFQSLSQQLIRLGYSFRGHSDTEVLLAAIEAWGVEEAVKKCIGMFAFAVWDNFRRELILCRDRMGEKPLFFGCMGGAFSFASELKALKNFFGSSLVIDLGATASFFRYGYVPTPYSIYQNVYKLVPGSLLRIPLDYIVGFWRDFSPYPDSGKFCPHYYWELEPLVREGVANAFSNETEAVNALESLLCDSIKQQLVADVPVGAFLSGGIDSSLVVALMQAVSTKPVETFTVGFTEKNFDEAPFAREIAKHLGTNHNEFYISANDSLGVIDHIPCHWDEPFADSSQIPSLMISKLARSKVTVCLTGDGGDELFCGYNRYITASTLLSNQQIVPLWARKATSALLHGIPADFCDSLCNLYFMLKKRGTSQANVAAKLHKFATLLTVESSYEAYRFLMSYWQNPTDVVNSNKELQSIIDRKWNIGLGDFVSDAMFWDQLGYLPDDNLVKGDRASMAVGLEARLPLLDHRIVELSWRLPLNMKFRKGTSKWLLRTLLYKYVPPSLIERPKMGFSVPIGRWLRGPLQEWGRELTASVGVKHAEMFDKALIEKMWTQHMDGSCDHSAKLWTLCMWLLWYEKWHSG